MARTPNILFAISDTGNGHRAAAGAIRAALEQQASTGAASCIEDLLAGTKFPLLRNAPALYSQLSTRWLPLFDFLFQLTNGRWRIGVLTQIVYLRAGQNVVRLLEETRPNLVVSTHPLINRLIGNTRRQHHLPFRFVTVVTDLVSIHASWAAPDADLCIVPTDEAYARIRKSGISEDKLVRTGFPVHPKFTVHTPKLETRIALGIAIEPFTVLITSGGVGAGNLRELVIELDRAYPQLQFLVVTGKNAALRGELQALGLRADVRIYGFIDNMEKLMAASDVIITKAGPGTLMEALMMRLPVIVTHAVGMQEHGNIDFVLNHELGTFCPTMDRVIQALAELTDPETYTTTAARLAGAVPRDGSAQIARILLEQVQLDPPQPHQRTRLPSVADLRRISSQQLHRISAWRSSGARRSPP